MEKYKIFLGSVNSKTYEEAKNFTFEAVEVYTERLNISLNVINRYTGDVFFAIWSLRDYHSALASKALLENNLRGFKENAFVAGFLTILGGSDSQWAYTGINTDHFALILLSDSQKLIDYLVTHRDEIVNTSISYERNDSKPYELDDSRPFYNANTLLALRGDWELLKERALTFLNDEKKLRSEKKRIPDHEFYVALADKDVEGMKVALSKLLELKLAKRASWDSLLHFDFYLQPQVLMYAKIAAIHGFDLGIDSPIAPKELIEINPLPEYTIPYDFMKKFDFDAPYQVWVDDVNQKMAEARAQNESKKGFWTSLFRW